MSADPNRPLARTDLEIEEAADGYVVFDESRDRVHYLNHTAVLIIELCTGENSVDDMVGMIQRAYELPEPPERETRECLAQLEAQGLLDASGSQQ